MNSQHSVPTLSDAALNGPQVTPWDVGPAIAELQELLCAYGFPLRVDGNYGYVTEKAVKQFQARHRLRADGVVNQATWQVLKKNVKPGIRVLRLGHTGMDVWLMQGLLQVNGYDVARTGVFDHNTEHGVMAFQQQHQLMVSGKVDGVTWAMLCNGSNPAKL